MAEPKERQGTPRSRAALRGAVGLVATLELGTFFETVLAPALVQVGLPVSKPATPTAPAVRGVRPARLRSAYLCDNATVGGRAFHAGVQVAGARLVHPHRYTYGVWIPEEDGGAANNLPEPTPALAPVQEEPTNVIQLFGR